MHAWYSAEQARIILQDRPLNRYQLASTGRLVEVTEISSMPTYSSGFKDAIYLGEVEVSWASPE